MVLTWMDVCRKTFRKITDGSLCTARSSVPLPQLSCSRYSSATVHRSVLWSESRWVSDLSSSCFLSSDGDDDDESDVVTTVFALLGFLSPSNRGSLATVMMVCWTFFGSVGGYVSARLYVSLGGTDKRRNSFVTATALPT
jgi:hypothetical protein